MRTLFTDLLEKAKKRGAYNSLDAMKLFAIINMTADHVGAYFFPHSLWWRAIGRITFPVWFFLVGYSSSRSLGISLWAYAGILIVDHPFVGRTIFPMNALVSVLLSRLMLNWCEDRKWLPSRLPEVMTACVMLTLPTMFLFEYGSIAFLYALLGRMVHTRQTQYLRPLVVTSYLTFILWQFAFAFNLAQSIYVILGSAWVVQWLTRCPLNVIWAQWTDSRWKTFITVLSRNTLPYYFYHRLIFEILAALLVGKGIGFSLRFF